MKNSIKNFLLFLLVTLSANSFSQNFALDLDAVNDKIGVNNSASLNPTTALTVETWINADTWKSSVWAGTIIGKQATSPDRGYCLTVGEGGKAEFTVSINNLWVSATTPAVMGLNSWYHIAGVFDGATLKVYINGVLQVTSAAVGIISASTATTMYIGENPTWAGRYFDGTVDEVRIWNTARTQSEIQANLGTELLGSETGLVAYYKMNENTGTLVGDATSNLNNGTMLNMDPATDWVSGFIVSTSDVGVVGIASPCLLGAGFTSSEKISVAIKNYATTAATGFQVNYKLNGGYVVTETVNATIQPFETYIHSFTNTENLNGQSSCSLISYTSSISDNNYANDTLTQTISQALTYPLFNNLQHNFGSAGQTNHKIFYMPDSLNDYSQILLHIDLNCPVGGCDPWDQYARLSLLKNGEAWELARYITPFGKACGGWVFDITDFRSKLVGQVDFESYIQVWGASGWLLNAVIELVPGTPAYKFVKIDKLWNNDYLVYGDPGISYNLTDTLMNIPNNAVSAKIRLTSTGHGQGNTGNAAEFYNATHTINVNGVSAFTQNLWKTDCATNSCTAQSGTYTYSRAGWCPGQDVQPQLFDLAGLFTPGQSISLDYVLQPYTNLLNTGYNNGSHTEPYLRVQGYLVSYGNSPLVSIKESESQNLELNVYPNPAKDIFSVYCKSAKSGLVDIKLYDAVGRLYYSKTANHLQGEWYEEISVKEAPMGFYFLKVKSESGIVTKKIILQ